MRIEFALVPERFGFANSAAARRNGFDTGTGPVPGHFPAPFLGTVPFPVPGTVLLSVQLLALLLPVWALFRGNPSSLLPSPSRPGFGC